MVSEDGQAIPNACQRRLVYAVPMRTPYTLTVTLNYNNTSVTLMFEQFYSKGSTSW